MLENVSLAVSEHEGIGGDMLRPLRARHATLEHAYALLERLRIAEDALTPVRQPPYGKQRLVEIAIALGRQPKPLLLDEPAAGVPSTEKTVILEIIEQLPAISLRSSSNTTWSLRSASPAASPCSRKAAY
jgi:ABC-type branched-subunit amino acid transport system ATPase component